MIHLIGDRFDKGVATRRLRTTVLDHSISRESLCSKTYCIPYVPGSQLYVEQVAVDAKLRPPLFYFKTL